MAHAPVLLSKRALIDRSYLEHRAKVLDLAAFIDRVERASGEDGDDFRMRALQACCALLLDGKPHRAQRVLELLSDQTLDPIAKAGSKGATGAVPPVAGGAR
ncbi:MAG: hypothetical protein EXS10_03080 [Phycisphaerales bacterium]|nr:hypothetical protein [Phycisphaerales bacterium]